MGLRNQYKTDPELELNGIEYETQGCVFVLARAGGANKRYNKIVEKLAEPYRRQVQKGILDRDVQDKIVREAFARAVLRSWEGVTFGDIFGDDHEQADEAAPCTVDHALKLFVELPELFIDLQDVATDAQAYRDIVLDEDAKN